jgi:3-phosphoshikimate 1-carboxyvinyltransferase
MPRQVARRGPLEGRFAAPASKPETQRAVIMAALAEGVSVIHRPLIARETEVMLAACGALGAEVVREPELVRIAGIGRRRGRPAEVRHVWAAGSALVARTFATLGLALPEQVVVDGNCVLRGRPFEPLFTALKAKGVDLRFLDGENRLPSVSVSSVLPGGRFRLGTAVSSQFVTALLVPAPLAVAPTVIELTGPHYSLSYIRQTVEMMRAFGVPARMAEDGREIVVPQGWAYAPRELRMTGDWTSASYILGAAFVTRGRITVTNLDPASAQGERSILAILEGLGARITWRAERHELDLDCTAVPAEVDAAFDLADGPNILPTVATLAATVGGRVRITGARLTQNHKSRRIDAMAAELAKAGVPVTVLHDDDGMVDGLEIHGRPSHAGGVAFGSHGDHRIFMSLALLALACERPCRFADADDTHDSFPGFLDILGLGTKHAEEQGHGHQLVAG